MANVWYKRRDAALLAQYRERVGAGIIAAPLEMRAIAGLLELVSSKGICRLSVT